MTESHSDNIGGSMRKSGWTVIVYSPLLTMDIFFTAFVGQLLRAWCSSQLPYELDDGMNASIDLSESRGQFISFISVFFSAHNPGFSCCT